jgi:starch synthase (maltosyl-transferring)
VNLDPFSPHDARVRLPLDALGIAPDETFQAHELLTDARHLWKGPAQRIRLDPGVEPAAIFRLDRLGPLTYGTPCY